MSISKLRGKSAIGVHNDSNNNVNYGSNKLLKPYVPSSTASLLKIEPFVPTFSTRFRKPIYRSYSTLSSSYFKRINDQKHHRVGRFPERNVLQHQRSRSTLSVSTKSSQNGVCRIARAPDDQERLPDRINYDRRGLTAIPIFDNERNLRLLSLQHNLINVFHVPHESKPLKVTEPDIGNLVSQTQNTKSTAENPDTNGMNKIQKDYNNPQLIVSASASTNSSATSNLTTLGTNTINFPVNSISPSSSNSLSPNAVLAKHTFVKKSVLLHANQKYSTLQKSKSFMNQVPYHLNSSLKSISQKCSPLSRSGAVPSAVNLASFGGDGSNHIGLEQDERKPAEANDIQALKVKNNQLSPSYGNIFENLVFLDLYDNQIEKISNLDGLKNLTVLLLGKNRISDVTGLASLKNTLRVLDLHGNKISNITNKLNCLQQLKSLNLAGNQIRQINHNDFADMINLKELNLKRNKIKRVLGFQYLVSLERLWLCHNDIHRVEDMQSIGDAKNLQEVTIENNPVSLAGDCVSFLVSYLPNLVMICQMPVTDQVRAAAMAWRKSKELSNANQFALSSVANGNIRREEVISNARTNWELLRSQQVTSPSKGTTTKITLNSSQVTETEQDSTQDQTRNLKAGQNKIKASARQANIDKKKRRKNRDKFKGNSEFPDLFRLPPIGQCQASKSKTPSEKTNSSGSSLGPNIDSSSSFDSSEENEEHCTVILQQEPETVSIIVPKVIEQPPVECDNVSFELLTTSEQKEVEVVEENSVKIEAPVENSIQPIESVAPTVEKIIDLPTVKPVEKNSNESQNSKDTVKPIESTTSESKLTIQSDKNSTCSTISLKPDLDVTSQQVSQADKGIKPRPGNISNRRYAHGTLMRSQTARNKSTVVNNGQSANPGNTNNTVHNTLTPAAAANSKAKPVVEREREQGGDYLIEICGRYLNVYGLGALKFIDKQWNAQKANDVHTLNFSYVNFNNIAATLGKIKLRFPNAESFVFRETNISTLGQLNALAELQGIASLAIDPEGNPIYEKNWRLYAIYRLSHWGLRTINGVEIAESEIEQAHNEYIGLSDLVLWSLPEVSLQPLLARLNLEESCSASKLSAKQWLMKADQSLKVVVGKEALQWKKPPAAATNALITNHHDPENCLRERGTQQLAVMIENTCDAVEKLQMLDTLWPNLLLDIVRNTLFDYSQLDVYVKKLMADIMQG